MNERVCLNFGFNTNGRDCSQMNVFKLIQFRFQYFPSIWMWRKRFEFNKIPKQLFNNSSIIAKILSEPLRVRGKKQSLDWLNSNLNWTTSKIDFILREFHNQSSCVWKKWFFKKIFIQWNLNLHNHHVSLLIYICTVLPGNKNG